MFTNITTDPLEVAKASGLYAVVDSGGKAGVILFTDSIYAIATAKTDADGRGRRGLQGLQGARGRRHADRRPAQPHGPAHDVAAARSTATSGPIRSPSTTSTTTSRRRRCRSAGIDPAKGYPRKISAGDGSVPAFQRIRDKQYQVATVAEPLNLHGWQTIDELNRAFAGETPSGYVAPRASVHSRQHRQGRRRRRTSSIPATATATQYKKIWGVK